MEDQDNRAQPAGENEVDYLPGYTVAGPNQDFAQVVPAGEEGTQSDPDKELVHGPEQRDDLLISGNAGRAGEMWARSLEESAENSSQDQAGDSGHNA